MPDAGDEALQNLRNRILFHKQNQLEGAQHNPDFDYASFWQVVEVAAQMLSKSFTQIALVYSNDLSPPADEVCKVVAEITSSLDSLVAVFGSVHRELGVYFVRDIAASLRSILTGMEDFLKILIECRRPGLDLHCVGLFWNAVEMIPLLPRNNKDAVSKLVSLEYDLLKDAVEELQMTIMEKKHLLSSGVAVVDDETWSELELKVAQEVSMISRLTAEFLNLGLISLKKNARIDTPEKIKDLDNFASSIADKFSKSMDNIASSLYPPLDTSILRNLLKAHFGLMRDYYEVLIICHFTSDEDKRLARLILDKIEKYETTVFQCLVTSQLESLAVVEEET